MRKVLFPLLLTSVLAVLGVVPWPTARADTDLLEIDVVVSPSTVFLASQGTWVSVHTDIPYGAVDHASLTLDGVEVAWTKADSRGYLVAKFELDAVKAILSPGTVTLRLEGVRVDGVSFFGEDPIVVKAGQIR
ncbi:MAG: hypothetical protein MUE73_10755 [Planctomycetes bacterium]|nr:hypothetical protein [Planctomycetota bacterium]